MECIRIGAKAKAAAAAPAAAGLGGHVYRDSRMHAQCTWMAGLRGVWKCILAKTRFCAGPETQCAMHYTTKPKGQTMQSSVDVCVGVDVVVDVDVDVSIGFGRQCK